jgi:5-methylcytosine-specific restriction endonuclease McrA
MCVASAYDGVLPEANVVAVKLRMPPAKVRAVVAELQAAGLIDDIGGVLQPHNWNGRQYKSDSSGDRVKRYRDRRRAAGLPALADYTKFRADITERDGERCVYCDATTSLVVDHMVPIALGGTDAIDNLALACKPCNSGKAGRTPELASMSIRVTSAAVALARYRDTSRDVTVSATPPENRLQSSVPNGTGATAPPDPKKELFDRGRQVLGRQSGGLISKLLKACGPEDHPTSIAKARARIEDASTKTNPAEWLGRVLAPRAGSPVLTETGQPWPEGIV